MPLSGNITVQHILPVSIVFRWLDRMGRKIIQVGDDTNRAARSRLSRLDNTCRIVVGKQGIGPGDPFREKDVLVVVVAAIDKKIGELRGIHQLHLFRQLHSAQLIIIGKCTFPRLTPLCSDQHHATGSP